MECDDEGLCDLTVQDRNVGQVVVHQDYRGDHGQPLMLNNFASLI